MQSAAAPWQALANAGQDIQGVGQKAFQFIQQQERATQEKQSNEMEIDLRTSFADYQNSMLTNPDPDSWEKGFTDLVNEKRKRWVGDDAKSPLALKFDDYASRQAVGIARDAAVSRLQLRNVAINNNVESALNLGAYDESRQAYEQFRQFVPPAKFEEGLANLNRRIEVQQISGEIKGDPLGMAAKLEERHEDGSWKNYGNISAADRARMVDQTRSQYRQNLTEVVDNAQDGIVSGVYDTPEKLETRFKGLVRPTVMQKLKEDLAEFTSGQQKAVYESQEWQDSALGKVSSLLSNYKASADDFDEQYVEMSQIVRKFPSGAVKDELQRQISDARSGQLGIIKDKWDAAGKALDQARKDGRFGGVSTQEISPAAAVQDGLLRDRAKLKAYGFDDASVKQIADLADSAAKTTDPKKRSAADKLVVEKFQDLHRFKQGAVTGSPLERQVFETIHNKGASTETIKISDGGAVDAAFGKVKADFYEWKKANPEATEQQINEKIFQLGSKADVGTILKGMPKMGGAPVPGSTSMVLPAGLAPYAGVFQTMGSRYGVDPRVLAAISMHETDSGKSSAFRGKNNAMGVSDSSGPIAFDTVDESIERMARLLGSRDSGPYKGAETINDVAGIYAPIGAGNDPGSLNQYWKTGVSNYLSKLGGDPSAPIRVR